MFACCCRRPGRGARDADLDRQPVRTGIGRTGPDPHVHAPRIRRRAARTHARRRAPRPRRRNRLGPPCRRRRRSRHLRTGPQRDARPGGPVIPAGRRRRRRSRRSPSYWNRSTADRTIDVHIEIAHPDARFDLPDHPSATITWHDAVAGAAPGASISTRSSTRELPDAVWVAGEAAAVQRLRTHLFDERGRTRRSVTARGYWKLGRSAT